MGEKKRRDGRGGGEAGARRSVSLATRLRVRFGDDERFAPLVQGVTAAGRLFITPEVIAAAYEHNKRMNRLEARVVNEEVFGTIRLPFERTWLEWDHVGVTSGEHYGRIGVLFERVDGWLTAFVAVLDYLGEPGVVVCLEGIRFNNKGDGDRWVLPYFEKHPPDYGDNPGAEQTLRELTTFGAALGMMILLLISARNTPVVIDREPMPDGEAWRRPIGSQPLPLRPVRWSLGRIERRLGRPATESEQREHAAHMCRGHFKTRKSGTFWWSSHWRGVGPRPTGGRDHIVEP